MPSIAGLRLATRGDVAAITDIAVAAYAIYTARIGREPGPVTADYAGLIDRKLVSVLECERRVMGFVVLVPERQTMLLDNIAVHPDAQGRGYGRALLDFAEETAKALSLDTIRLYTNEAMTENIALYARLGYRETHRAEEHGYRRVFMQKSIDPRALSRD